MTVGTLERWRAAARRVGAPLAEQLLPGLDDAEIDGLLEPLGLRAPADLRTLWGWGVAPDPPGSPSGWRMHPAHKYLPPARAIEDTIENRAGADWGIDMPEDWIVVWNDQVEALCLDCSQPGTTPVYSVSADNTLFADSVAQMLERWIALIDLGYTEMHGPRWADKPEAPPSCVYGPFGVRLPPPTR